MMSSVATARFLPENLMTGYNRFYKAVHGRGPRIRHMGGQWYQVNGEIVHHKTLLQEIERLRQLARRKSQPEKGLVTRLIERLRLM